jgi:hypothetical protein
MKTRVLAALLLVALTACGAPAFTTYFDSFKINSRLANYKP